MSKTFVDRSQQNSAYNPNSNASQKKIDPIAQLKWLDNAVKAPSWNASAAKPAQMTEAEDRELQMKRQPALQWNARNAKPAQRSEAEEQDLIMQRKKAFEKHGFKVPAQKFANDEKLTDERRKQEEQMQMKEGDNSKNTDSTASSSSSTGIPEGVRAKMENAFNADFSSVKVHSNSPKAIEVGALAYTQGNDIHFAPGQYNPASSKGQELLAHELTHVVQQRQGRVQPTMQTGGMPINDSPALEKEADTVGGKVVQGKMIGEDLVKVNNVEKDSNNEFLEGDPPQNGRYVIKSGDTFEKLEKRWNLPLGVLKKCNPGVSPNNLQIDQIITTPYKRGGVLIFPIGGDEESFGSKSEKIANELIKRNKGKATGFGNDFEYTDQEKSLLFGENGEFTNLGRSVNEIIKEQGYLQKRNKEAADFFSGLINSGILTNAEISELTAIRSKVKSETMAKYLQAIYSPDIVGTILFISLGAQGSANLQSKAASFSPKFAQSTAKVWSSINSTGANVAGTQIPKSFVLNGKYWVHPNATKHMVEYVVRVGNPATAPIRSQLTLSSFKSVVDQLTRQAIKMNKMYTVGNWEIMFSKSAKDVLPVIKHARMIL